HARRRRPQSAGAGAHRPPDPHRPARLQRRRDLRRALRRGRRDRGRRRRGPRAPPARPLGQPADRAAHGRGGGGLRRPPGRGARPGDPAPGAAAAMKLATPRWWYTRDAKVGAVTRALLTPVSWIWAAAAARRIANGRPADPGVPVICVGNLTMG